jgi:hypothetical protein
MKEQNAEELCQELAAAGGRELTGFDTCLPAPSA